MRSEKPGRLFAVAERRVENREPVPRHGSSRYTLVPAGRSASPIYSFMLYDNRFDLSTYLCSCQDLSAFLTVAVGAELLGGGHEASPDPAGDQPGRSGGSRRSSASACSTGRRATGTLTEAGRLLQDYAQRLLRLAGEAEAGRARAAAGAARPGGDRRQRSGGPHAAAVHRAVRARSIRRRSSKCAACRRARWPPRSLDRQHRLRRPDLPARRQAALQTIPLGARRTRAARRTPEHPLATTPPRDARGSRPPDGHRAQRSVAGARARAARCTSAGTRRSTSRSALPSLDGIKRAVEMGIGVAVLPRRCALDGDFARPAWSP